MRYRVNHPQVINESIDGESIMINLATGSYYSLDTVGGEVWGLVEQSYSVDDIATELGRRYAASEDDIRSAVEHLLGQLSHEQLVVEDPQAPAPPVSAGSPVAVALPFRRPTLEKFTDMQDLILLDPVHEVDTRGWPHVPDGRPSN